MAQVPKRILILANTHEGPKYRALDNISCKDFIEVRLWQGEYKRNSNKILPVFNQPKLEHYKNPIRAVYNMAKSTTKKALNFSQKFIHFTNYRCRNYLIFVRRMLNYDQ